MQPSIAALAPSLPALAPVNNPSNAAQSRWGLASYIGGIRHSRSQCLSTAFGRATATAIKARPYNAEDARSLYRSFRMMKDRNLVGRLASVRLAPDAGGVVLDLGRPGDDPFAGRGAAADGPAPEGGTASSASAKVPFGRLAPRRPRTPTEEGIQRRRTCPGF
jgi:hypothetical protein